MLHVVGLAVIAGTFLELAQAQTAPRNMNDCKLNSSSPFSWVVQIWDEQKDGGAGTASIGSLVTYRAVLTTAWYFSLVDIVNNLNRYTVYGQNIWDYSKGPNFETARSNPCRQERKILQIELHPKSSGGELGKLLFDYSIVYLEKVFNVSSPTVPVMRFPEDVAAFLYKILLINSRQSPDCEMPVPETESNRFLVFNPDIKVKNLLFRTYCIKYICEEPSRGTVNKVCSNNFEAAPNGTILCMVPQWTKRFDITPRSKLGDYPNYLAGTPLICSGTTYGISTQVKRRAILDYKDFKQSFFFVVTLLRVWQWLKTNILFYSAYTENYVIPKTPPAQEFYDPPPVSLDFKLPTSPPRTQFDNLLNMLQKQNSGSRLCNAVILKISFGTLHLMLTYI